MRKIKDTTKQGKSIIATFNSCDKGTIWEAYQKPSSAKVKAYQDILRRAIDTPGYNKDLKVTGASTFCFLTMYSFRDNEGFHIVYDTPSNTVQVVIAE